MPNGQGQMIVRANKQRGLGEVETAPDYDDGRLTIRPRDFLAFGDGQPISLTTREIALLAELCRHAGSTRTREQLLEAVWGPDADVLPRAVDVAITRLRAKLDDALPDLNYVWSYHGVGYGFDPPA